MRSKLIFIVFCLIAYRAMGQAVGVGTTSPNTSAKLEVTSTNSGFLLPRMTSAERNAIPNPAMGLLVYDLDKNAYYTYDGARWLPLMTANPNHIPPTIKNVSDLNAGDSLGWSVAISGDYAIAGAPGDDVNGNIDQGSAYIFFRQNGVWTEQAKITAVGGAAGDRFGFSVGISGDCAVIGAPYRDVTFVDEGTAYTFLRTGTTWTQATQVPGTGLSANDRYGYSVAISGTNLVVGCPYFNYSLVDQGGAFLFFRNNNAWFATGFLLHPNPAANDNFASAVSIAGDYIAAGCPGRDTLYNGTQTDAGAVYIYYRNAGTWGLQKKFAGFVTNWILGSRVSLVNDGVTYSIQTATGHVIDYWRRVGTDWPSGNGIVPPTSSTFDYFGWGMSLSSDYILAGLYRSSQSGQAQSGGCILYKKNGIFWNYVRTISDNVDQFQGHFGWACAIDGFNIIIGAKGKNSSAGEVQFLNIE